MQNTGDWIRHVEGEEGILENSLRRWHQNKAGRFHGYLRRSVTEGRLKRLVNRASENIRV
ncbi:MAG: hypothetical protein QXO68_05315 [Conexivisphaerales archaeon]